MAPGQVVKWGNSLAIRIPKPLAEEAGLCEGDGVVLEASEGQIEVRRRDRIPTLKQLVAQITAENRYQESWSGPDRGKEKIEW
jgi:antitoxin MazE